MNQVIGAFRRGRAAIGVVIVLSLAAPAWAGPAWIDEVGSDPSAARTGAGAGRTAGGLRPADVPEIFGPGKVTTYCNVWMKVTNIGVLGNPFTNTSSDPSGQWPGASGVEYLFFAGLWVGAKDPTITDPTLVRRVSQTTEWRPPTLDPRDHIYTTFDGQVNGQRFVDDDQDGRIDEDPLDGYDNDGDGKVDEDYGAISQLEYTCLIRDDTEAAINQAAAEKHVPRGLQCRQNTYAFSVPGANDFVSVEWEIENVSGHTLDSVYVGVRIDQDCGPVVRDRYYADDLPEPRVPQGPDPTLPGSPTDPDNPNYPYLETVGFNDPRFQGGACSIDSIFVNGFTITDDDGDLGQTPGASTFLLLNCTTDPTGLKAPKRVGFNMYTYYSPGVPFSQGGVPTTDIERYEAMAQPPGLPFLRRNVDPNTGLITQQPPDRNEIADYSSLCAVGPFSDMQPGEKIKVAWALAVQQVDYTAKPDELQKRYGRIIRNAVDAQKTFNGSYESRQGIPVPGPTDFGRETCFLKLPGGPLSSSDCHDDSTGASRPLKEQECTWFDLDCNYCTGVPGLVLKRWTASSPPPNPQIHAEAGDRKVTVEWDNRSEYTADPVTGIFDFAGYKVWKASNWTRPVGSTGPGDDLWALLATYYYYDPVLNPLKLIGSAGQDSFVTVPVLLNRETGTQLYPQDIACLPGVIPGSCDTNFAKKNTFTSTGRDSTIERYPVVKYPIGRYVYEDPNVLNGFLYFYSVTAFDSSGRGLQSTKLEGREAATETDGVVPQKSFSASNNDGKPYVVPNPYRGRADWDLTPNAADPTGTHIDFFNLPADWSKISIYTVSGDLVQLIEPSGQFGTQVNGKPQRESADDSEASWNLVSRNGQDIVSGIYIFSVQTQSGKTAQGKFTVIR